jgi:putative ABC transport system permease protein
VAGAVALWAVASCAVATWWRARAPRRTTSLRSVAEGALVVLAIAAVAMLRARGLDEDRTGVDPLLAAAPVLVALALAAVLMRVLPVLVTRLAAARRGSRGLVSFLGLARAARQPAVLAAPLAALLVALCFAVFATGAVRTVDDAQVSGAWRDVGADYRVTATFIPPEILQEVEDLDGVELVAPAYVRDDAGLVDTDGRTVPGLSVAVDTEAYAAVLAQAPGGVADRDTVRDLGRDTGGEDDPLPVLLAGGAAEVLDRGASTVDLGGGIGDTEVAVRAEAERFPLDAGRPVVVADLAAVQDRESAPVRPNTLLVVGEPGLADRLDSIVGRSGQPHGVLDRRVALREVQASPFVGSTRDLFALVVPAALLYALLATVLALVLAAPTRRRDVAVLRRLGASSRESLRLALTEQAPPVVGMLLGGVLAGLGLVRLALGAVDLAPLTGGAGPPAVSLPLATTTLLTGGLLVLVATTTALVSVAERRRPTDSRHDGSER